MSSILSLMDLSTTTDLSHVVTFRGTAPDGRWGFLAPLPAEDEGMILTAFVDVPPMFDEHIADALLRISSARTQLWQAVDYVLNQVETVHFVQYDHIERRRGGTFLLVA